jgi:putative nucleotidyltransferase with HDIG domain
MPDVITPNPPALQRLELSQIDGRIAGCPRLPSLSTVNVALREILSTDNRYTSQIAEIIRRDPSLTARLLRLVNSVYYGFSTPINSIEEAVFYIGVRQIRRLAMMTPIIEDFQMLAGASAFAWRDFWQHCIGTAILTQEVTGMFQAGMDDSDYVAGLVHDVGRIAMAAAFPDHFAAIHRTHEETQEDLREIEESILGIDHTELGALYLRNHRLPEVLIESARHHHSPQSASRHPRTVAAVQIADLLVRHAGIGNSGNRNEVTLEDWQNASGWQVIAARRPNIDIAAAQAHLIRSLERLRSILDSLV